ncbi:hypothetical protein EBX31_08470, partial [bacterium]|nr:hypothetical protein [bacterium]
MKSFSAKTVLLIFLLISAQGRTENLFTPPEAAFITNPKEVIHRLTLPAGKVEAAQSLIDSARKEKPDAVLILEAAGNLEVEAVPLRLGSKMCLHLSPSAGVVASTSCSAPSLISVEKAEFVSVSSDGTGCALVDGG